MSRLKFFILCLYLPFITGELCAQGEKNIWYFGNHAGLDFNSGSPVALTDGMLNTQEGCSTISDNLGNLLFYTDGITVWDRSHSVMPNGTGLSGHISTTQSALIVPIPGDVNKYYIFTIYELGGAMKYSIVDMTLNSGFGDVVSSAKNVLLHSIVSEKQTAIQGCDGNIWLLSHEWGTSNFFADRITTSGISPSVISSVGSIHSGSTLNSIGSMKFSQQGHKVALAMGDYKKFEVFDFDINLGILSNPISISSPTFNICSGVEFSPNGNVLYCSSALSKQVFQFNLLAGSPAAVIASSVLVGTGIDYLCAMQLGVDGKIYVAKTTTGSTGPTNLDVINNPNVLGLACGYSSSTLSLSGKMSLAGIPNFMIKVTTSPNINITGINEICLGQSTTLTATGSSIYQWAGGDSSTSSTIIVSPLVTTTYYVIGDTSSCGILLDTITVVVDELVNISTSASDSICSGQSLTLSSSGSTAYVWSGGISSIGSSVLVSPTLTTTYYVTGLTNACGNDTDTVLVFVEPQPNISVSGLTSICSGQSVTLTASGASTYIWSGASSASAPSITVTPSSTSVYFVSASGVFCLDDIDTVIVTVADYVPALFSFSYDECEHQILFQNLSVGAQSYFWDFGNGVYSALENPINNYSDGVYNVVFTTNPGFQCSDSIQQVVTVASVVESSIQIPNVFTPNGDGINDEFRINYFSNCYVYELLIFNRWGQLVFETTDPESVVWNGGDKDNVMANAGLYYYILSVKERGDDVEALTGFVSLIR